MARRKSSLDVEYIPQVMSSKKWKLQAYIYKKQNLATVTQAWEMPQNPEENFLAWLRP